MVDQVQYGDTSGTLADRERAGDQTLPIERLPGPPNDTLFLYGDADALAGRAVGGDDTFGVAGREGFRFGGFNVLFGDARSISENAEGGNDVLAAVGSSTQFGDAQEMAGRGRGGDDVLTGGAVAGARLATFNSLYGDAYEMSGRTEGGDDTLTGTTGLEGSTARLYGDAYEMSGRARGGDDRLVSTFRTDEMWGDAFTLADRAEGGEDVFVFTPPNGRDIIHDFEPGKDRIDLTAYAADGIGDFPDLAPRLVVQPDGTLVILDTGSRTGNSVVVAGVSGLGADDFLLG